MELVDKDWLLQRLNLFKDTKYYRYLLEGAETVELIECKDCRYREEDHRCRLIGLLTRDYDFCSYAERKDENIEHF